MKAIPSPHLVRRGSVSKLPVFGVDIEVLAGRAQTNGEFASYLATCAPGAGAPPHRHDGHHEAFFVLEGEIDLRCGDRVHRLQPGDFAVAPRGMVHGFMGVGPGSSRLIGFGVPGGHEEFFQACAAAIADGTFSPQTGAAICRQHGIELVGANLLVPSPQNLPAPPAP
jgi:quercetin dioxygenase-like cupin family protein